MKQKSMLPLGLLYLGLLFLVGCKPLNNFNSTLTAMAWTWTPVPTNTPRPTATSTVTPTPTPIPYNLTIKVEDSEGIPVFGAMVSIDELGELETAQGTTSSEGSISWENLPNDSIRISVAAQGFLPTENTQSIERGSNEILISLERDPDGLLPSEACREAETLLYVEDFQDGQAEDWPEIQNIDPGWSTGALTEEPGNQVLSAQFSAFLGNEPVFAHLGEHSFDNAVWRIKFLITGKGEISFKWLHTTEPLEIGGGTVTDSHYEIMIGTNVINLRRLQAPLTVKDVARSSRFPRAGEWHQLEISTFQGAAEVWLDGTQIMAYIDPQPMPAGSISLTFSPPDETTLVYFDNISICELVQPFGSGDNP